MAAFTYHQVMVPFVDFLFSFGKQDYPREFHFSGLYHETNLSNNQPSLCLPELGRSGKGFRLCYNLKSVEPSDSQPQFPWSVRQLAVYHSFDVGNGKALWIIIKGDQLIKRRIKAATNPRNNKQQGFSGASEGLSATLSIHLIIFDWCREQWRVYISYLEQLQDTATVRCSLIGID